MGGTNLLHKFLHDIKPKMKQCSVYSTEHGETMLKSFEINWENAENRLLLLFFEVTMKNYLPKKNNISSSEGRVLYIEGSLTLY